MKETEWMSDCTLYIQLCSWFECCGMETSQGDYIRIRTGKEQNALSVNS